MDYLKGGSGVSRKYDEAKEMARPLTPKSERPRSTWGSLEMSLQTSRELCGKARPGKGGCWRRAGHEGECP